MAEKIKNSLYKVVSKAWKILLVCTVVVLLGNIALPGIIKTSNIVMGFIASAVLMLIAFLLNGKFDFTKLFGKIKANKSIASKISLIVACIFAFVCALHFIVFIVRLFIPGFAPGVNSKPIVFAIVFGILAGVCYFFGNFINKVDEETDEEEVEVKKPSRKDVEVIDLNEDDDDEDEDEQKVVFSRGYMFIGGSSESNKRHVLTDKELDDVIARAYAKGKASKK